MLENINLAFQGVWSHKLRSFLTMLGIIIGIAAIITIVSTIQGTNEQIKQNLIGAGNNVVRVTIGATDSQNYFDLNYSALPEGIDPVTREMRDEMEKLGSVSLVSMYYSRDWCDNVYVGNTAFSGSLYGVDDHYLTAVDYAVNYGRSFTAADYENRRNVALIDAKSAKSLFQGENPIGGTIEINGMPFTVVGVVSSRSSSGPVINNFKDYQMYAGSTAGTIFIPDVCWSVPYRYDEPQYAAVRATSTNDMTAAGDNVAKYLNENVIRTTKYKYESKDLLQQASDLQSLSESTNKQLIWIGYLAGGGRPRRDEHHAGVRDGAHPRDRIEDRHRRAAEPHPLAVPDGSGGADQHGRHTGRGYGHRPGGDDVPHHGDTGGHQRTGVHHRGGLLHGHRRGVRPGAGHEGIEAEPH